MLQDQHEDPVYTLGMDMIQNLETSLYVLWHSSHINDETGDCSPACGHNGVAKLGNAPILVEYLCRTIIKRNVNGCTLLLFFWHRIWNI